LDIFNILGGALQKLLVDLKTTYRKFYLEDFKAGSLRNSTDINLPIYHHTPYAKKRRQNYIQVLIDDNSSDDEGVPMAPEAPA